ncbi:MAG: chalcone isomerase family protein [Waddliaceae bacterium]
MNQWTIPLWGFTFLIACFAGVCAANEMIEDKTTGKTFPVNVTFTYEGNGYDLKATGAATRKKLFIKIYSIAHYMQDPSALKEGNIYDDIINSDKAKQLTAKWVRSVDQERFKKGYLASFKKAVPPQLLTQLRPTFDQFLTFFGEVSKNDTQVIRSLPGGVVIVEINGVETGRIQNEEFAKALWSIWFGPNSIVNRKDLVSQLQ